MAESEKVWFDPVHRRIDFGSFKGNPSDPWITATLTWEKPQTEEHKRRERVENALNNCVRAYKGKHAEAERSSDIAEFMACYDMIHSTPTSGSES